MAILNKTEIDYVNKRVTNSDNLTVLAVRDELYMLSVDSLDDNDDPTDETFMIERIMDAARPYNDMKWGKFVLL